MSEAPKMLYVPTGILPSAIDRYEAGETTSLILTAFDTPVYEDDYAYRRADLPWLPEELVDDLRIAVYEDFADPFDRLAAMTLAAEHIFDAINALNEGEK